MRTFLICAVFLVAVALMYRRRLNALIGLPVMALAIAVAAGIPWRAVLTEVISEGALRLATPMIVIMFGATLAELVRTSGVVEVLIRNTAEFLGDRVYVTAMALVLVVALLFTVLSGLGAAVMVGSIVLPIMVSLGMSKALAASVFLIGVSLGGMLNLVNWAVYTDVLGLPPSAILTFVVRFLPVALGVTAVFVAIEVRREGGSSFKLRMAEPRVGRAVRPLAYLTPVVPVALVMAGGLAQMVWPSAQIFQMPIIPAMLAGIVTGAFAAPASAGPRLRIVSQAVFDGVASVGPALGLMIGIGMLLKAVMHPAVTGLLGAPIAAVMPTSPWGYVLFFAALSPLALYRGPLSVWGMGSGLVALMRDAGAVPPAAIMAALVSVGQLQTVCDPTNTHNVWVANYLGIDVLRILRKAIVAVWIMALAGLVLSAGLFFQS